MAVTLSGGEQQARGGTFMGIENMTMSTATARQSLSLTKNISILGMGTATGTCARNIYSLASTGVVEGMEKVIRSEATGEASVFIGGGHAGRVPINVAFSAFGAATTVDALAATATGMWIFTATDQALGVKFVDGRWRYMWAGSALGPTYGTTT